jgi:hypothetical protein
MRRLTGIYETCTLANNACECIRGYRVKRPGFPGDRHGASARPTRGDAGAKMCLILLAVAAKAQETRVACVEDRWTPLSQMPKRSGLPQGW